MKNTQCVVIVAGGTLTPFITSDMSRDAYCIGVDKAAYWLLRHGIVPVLAIGDFDSVTKQEFSVIKKRIPAVSVFPPEKDATDLELALLHAVARDPQEIVVYGGIGTRMDHTVAAIQLLEKFALPDIRIFIRDERNEITLVSGVHTCSRKSSYRYLSVLPVTETAMVSIDGCAYPLKNRSMIRGESLGVSNEITEEYAVITVHSGLALVIRSRD